MFFHLIILALVGIVLTLCIDWYRTRTPILHTLRKSCTINQVQLSKDMRGTTDEAKRAFEILRIRIVQMEKGVMNLNGMILRHVKSYIRKRLRSQPVTQSSDSTFIKKLQVSDSEKNTQEE